MRSMLSPWRPSLSSLLRGALVTAGMLASTAAFAQGADGGPAPARCGETLTSLGACFGDVLAWCEEPNLDGASPDAAVRSVDCARLSLDGAHLGATCAELAGGASCGVPRGSPCALPGANGVVQLACLSEGALDLDAACDLDRGCVEGAACSGAEPTCEGDRLQLACARLGQVLVVDCASLGGTCASDACVDVAEGGRCGAGVACADGLTCVGDEGGLGTCLREGAPVTPVDPPDADPPPPPASCAAIHPAGGRPLGWLALAILAILRGWRGKGPGDRCRGLRTQ